MIVISLLIGPTFQLDFHFLRWRQTRYFHCGLIFTPRVKCIESAPCRTSMLLLVLYLLNFIQTSLTYFLFTLFTKHMSNLYSKYSIYLRQILLSQNKHSDGNSWIRRKRSKMWVNHNKGALYDIILLEGGTYRQSTLGEYSRSAAMLLAKKNY